MIYITKGKTLRANTIDEGAVGKLYCVLVQAGAMGGGGGYTIRLHLQYFLCDIRLLIV